MVGIFDIDKASNLSYQQRLDIYKKIGFKEIALFVDNSYLNDGETYFDIINYAKSIGLSINQAHADYKISNLICDETTDEYFNYMYEKLCDCKQLGIKYLVAHASRNSDAPEISVAQLEKLSALMDNFKGDDVFLCLENVRNNTNLHKVLQLNHPQIKMCFDLGHAHCFDNEDTLFDNCKQHIVCSHLHNNFGDDTHNLPTNGEIDFQKFLTKLENIENASNCLECFPPRGSNLTENQFQNFVQDCFESVQQ